MKTQKSNFESDLLRLLGMENRSIKKLVLTIEVGCPVKLETEEIIPKGFGVLVRKQYKFEEA